MSRFMITGYWKRWVKAAGIRAVRTFAQALIPLIPVGIAVNEIGWAEVLGVAATSAILSLVTSLGGLPEIEVEADAD